MKKKIYALVMVLVILVGALGTVVSAEETEQAQEQEQVNLEDASNKLKELTEEEKELVREKEEEEKKLLVPTISEKFFFNDFAQMYEEKEIGDVLENAERFKKDEEINFVISTIESFEGVNPNIYAGLMYDVYSIDNAIVLVISDEEMGVFISYNDESFEINEEIQKEIEEFSANRKIENLLELQNVLVKFYKEEVLKDKLVLDKEKVFSDEETKTLNMNAKKYKEESGIEILIVTSAEKFYTKDLDKYSNNLWICMVLDPDDKNLDILVSKDAEEYITSLNVTKICNDAEVKEDFQKEDYGKSMIYLQEAFVKHLKEYDANVNERKIYRRVEIF